MSARPRALPDEISPSPTRPHTATGAATESEVVDALILDLLEWIGPVPRPYAEVLEAWRTSCPRLPVWEAANDLGFITRHRAPGRGAFISASAAGMEHLRKHRQPSPR
jgi:hypothetical protein